MVVSSFSHRVLKWFDQYGRKSLPWQQDINPYRVWISEIMLQQTQVTTVIPYFQRFMQRFPDVFSLAKAPQDDVLALWSGLGYYARARNLHKAAKQVVSQYQGNFPEDRERLSELSGVGRSTAAAILSLSHGKKEAILDGNVKRVLCRHKGVEGWPGKAAVHDKLWGIAEDLLPNKRLRDYTQAMMDIGATVCTRTKPVCEHCPVNKDCVALEMGTQAILPTSKPKKKKPEKESMLLILKNSRNQILMYKRPPSGIWGGLWCLPECESEPQLWCKNNLGLKVKKVAIKPKLKHVFTHFVLHIQPVEIPVLSEAASIKETEMQWYNLKDALKLGLPAPVTTLLKGQL